MVSSDDDLTHGIPRRRTPRKRAPSHGSFTTSGDENDDDPGEQRVEDVTIQFFYKPRTVTLLLCLITLMIYFAFVRDANSHQHSNFWHGSLGVAGFFLVISVLICPNGPFVRPHPAVWRVVLGASIIYTCCLVFALFQSYQDILTILQFLDPALKDAKQDTEVYAEDCSLQILWSRIDVFVIAHFLGFVAKALMVRNAALLWLLSITWEFTEIAFSHLLENFKECWWDSLILDVLLCNGLGIHFGLWLCKKLEMRQYYWESIKDISGTSKKIKRVVMQFTPVSWTEVRWFDPKCIRMRYTFLCLFCIIWQISELNTFFLKHIFVLPTGHWINILRIVMLFLVVMPTLRCITFLEAILCVRHARELFSQTEFIHVAWWILFQLLFCFALIYFLIIWRGKRSSNANSIERKKYTKTHATHSQIRFKESKAYDGDDDDEAVVLRPRRPLRD